MAPVVVLVTEAARPRLQKAAGRLMEFYSMSLGGIERCKKQTEVGFLSWVQHGYIYIYLISAMEGPPCLVCSIISASCNQHCLAKLSNAEKGLRTYFDHSCSCIK